jgi:hypothetical protein
MNVLRTSPLKQLPFMGNSAGMWNETKPELKASDQQQSKQMLNDVAYRKQRMNKIEEARKLRILNSQGPVMTDKYRVETR